MANRHDQAVTDGGQTPSAARLLLGAFALFACIGPGIYVAAEAIGSNPSFFELIGAYAAAWIGLLIGIGLCGIIAFGRPGGDA